jgi:quercetin dioxygenase-like cupin family protein
MPIHHDMLGSVPTDTERTFVPLADDTLGATSCSVFENVLNPGALVPWHTHAVEEIIVCTSGVGEFTLQDCAPEPYRAGSVLIIPAKTLHSLRNVGPERLCQFAIFGGASPGTEWRESEGSVGTQSRAGRDRDFGNFPR